MSKKILFLSAAMIIGVSFFAGVKFSLAENPSVTILSPNGGETLKNDGSPITVMWQTSNIPASHKFILIRLRAMSNGQEYNLALDALNDGQEALSIPASIPVGAYKLEIKTYVDNILAMDSSDSYFKLVDVSQNQPVVTAPTAATPVPVNVSQNQPSVTVLSPNGGENLQSGSSYYITWAPNNLPPDAFVNIWLLDSPTRLGSMILAKVPNTGSANWVASPLNVLTDQKTLQPATPSGKYVIFIECADRSCTVDDSNNPFIIAVPSVKVEEQVKCVFKGSDSEQKCYLATNDSSNYAGYGCSGKEACVVDMKGMNGDKLTWKSSCGGYAYTVMNGSSEYAVFNCATPVTMTTGTSVVSTTPTTTMGPRAVTQKEEQIFDINEKSKLLTNNNFEFILAELNQLRNIIKEQQTEIKYLKSLVVNVKELSDKSLDAINKFITYGVDANTEKLGAGERAAVISSYKNAFEKLPETEAELADAIKIANGRFPSVTSDEAEKIANEQFVKIYKREPDLKGVNDNAAIKVMAYGLRQKAENRNLNSEKEGIKIFKNIFGAVPKTTEDWNTMQAITYSGATR